MNNDNQTFHNLSRLGDSITHNDDSNNQSENMLIVPTNADKEIIDLSIESNSILLDKDCTVTYKDL